MLNSSSNSVLLARNDVEIRLLTWVRRWFWFGLAAWLLVPALRSYNVYIGWWPFWLLAAPTILIVLMQRARLARLAAALSTALVGRRRRRLLFGRGQARRAVRPRLTRQAPRTAA